MAADDEVEAYASAAAQQHLQRIDSTFVDHVCRLGVDRGLALDVGTGPAQIPIAILQRLPELRFVAVDRSLRMLQQAHQAAEESGVCRRLMVLEADGRALPFRNGSFDLVCSNSLLHHLEDPAAVLKEMSRVLRPGGAFLLRDLRRPSWLSFPWHVGWHGRHYEGRMRELFRASVAAAYTPPELKNLIDAAPSLAQGTRTFRVGRAHIGFERPAAAADRRF